MRGGRVKPVPYSTRSYITAPAIKTWNRKGLADHNITRVVSGIAADALAPSEAAALTVKIVAELTAQQ